MTANILTIIYLIASVTFILGLKMLSHPETARRGNLIAAAGMALAIFGTIFLYRVELGVDEKGNTVYEPLGNLPWMFAALAIGAIVGAVSSRRVKMTAMPEMVSLFNGMGGACAMLISIIEFNHIYHNYLFDFGFNVKMWGLNIGSVKVYADEITTSSVLVIVVGLVIGAISFTGSIIAWGKLNGRIKDRVFKGQTIINLALLILLIALIVLFLLISPITSDSKAGGFVLTLTDGTKAQWGMAEIHLVLFFIILAIAILYGILFVLPIGGADMPVVISLLNSFTGVAAACGGFMYNNKAMLTGGILVGAAGTLLTILMCKAMNRSLLNVIVGAFGGGAKAATGSKEQGHYKEIALHDAAMVMSYANKVMIVPGYGLAVAQAQHVCHELEKILTEKGVEVKYAIHPVAGRMPGHMNVLLAEADVAYDKLLEMEEANDEFKSTDVVLVLGANDVVNPAAKTDPSSPIYGMPILEAELAKNTIVNKRSMKPGYAGIENDLFFQPKTSMLFGDAKKVLQDLCTEIKAV